MSEKKRQLAAIMFTDIVGYSAMMQRDESLAASIRKRHREVFRAQHEHFSGKILQYYGDGTLSIFDSAVEAVECAVAMQQAFREGEPKVPLRIGIHTGDITYEEEGAYGDGLNIAARIEPLCTPGGVFVSGKVYDDIKNHPWLEATSLGLFDLKNILHKVELYAIANHGLPVPDRRTGSRTAPVWGSNPQALQPKPALSTRLMVDSKEGKDKEKAALMALLLGWLGVHRFYLGQRRRAIAYVIFGAIGFISLISDGDTGLFLLMLLIGLIDAVLIYSLSDAEFDNKYNRESEEAEGQDRDYPRERAGRVSNRYKKRGVRQFRAGNYKEALADFKRALKQEPEDMAVHFNLACCYSLFDQPRQAMDHLVKSVEYGFWNFEKIHEHFALENLRKTAAFQRFVDNDYRLAGELPAPAEPDLLESQPTATNILDQIANLGELKERGVITEEEFIEQKRRLLDDEG